MMSNIRKLGIPATSVIMTIIAITLLVPYTIIPIGLAKAQSNSPSPGITAGEYSLGLLNNQYWNWLYGLDTKALHGNPFTDKTGKIDCEVGLQQNGWFFMVGTGGVTTDTGESLQYNTQYDRTCKTPVSHDVAFFIPLFNAECTDQEFGYNAACTSNPGEQRRQIDLYLEHATDLNIFVDGVSLINQVQRIESPGDGFQLTMVPNNPFADFGTPYNVKEPTTFHAFAGGYYLVLTGLSPGTHTIKFGGALVLPDESRFQTEATYHMTIN